MPVGAEAANTVKIQSVDEASSYNAFGVQREDVKKQRQLEEARKSGLIPAEKDEEGKDINPHIPQYIVKAPWYLNQGKQPSLKHQRHIQESSQNSKTDRWYRRGLVEQKIENLKYRKGACTNCGALTHTAKSCTERPRKIGAKYTGQDIRPDELLVQDSVELQLDFDGKRDRYGGYNPHMYQLVIHEYELTDAERKKRRALELQEGSNKTKETTKDPNLDSADSESKSKPDASPAEEDEEEYDEDDDVKVKDFEETNAPLGMKDDRTRTTTMNLRIREDTAKYLFNLDVNSAFYDPKTRSMRDNPLKHLNEAEQGIYAGDNAMRSTGEANSVKQLEVFAWEAYKHNVNLHLQAQPTQLELMHRDFRKKKENLVMDKRQQLIGKYGGAEHLASSKFFVPQEVDTYVEFNPVNGMLKCIGERSFVKSKYDDDTLFGDHTEVWGSWYDMTNQSWGYLCCKQSNKYESDCRPISTILMSTEAKS